VRSIVRVTVVMASVGFSSPAGAQDPAPRPGSSGPASRQPIRDSVDRAVERVVLAHQYPCDRADRLGVPCFPMAVEQEGPRFSVADALRRYRAGRGPTPGRPPTVAETLGQLSGAPLSASGGVSFDPVCTAKNLVKRLSGRATTYHLYRMSDRRGDRPLLTDRPLDPNAYATHPDVHYEYLGKFDGECEAVAAWRAALRRATEKKPVPAEEWRKTRDPEPPRR
jgi:hypothetical protein